jgi:hypothetical protein
MVNIVDLATCKVAYVATQTDATGSNIFMNDPSTNVAVLTTPPLNFYDGEISKSSDGGTFVSSSSDSGGEDLAVYDAASDSYNCSWSTRSARKQCPHFLGNCASCK